MKRLSVLMLATAAVWIMAAPVSAGERAGAFSVSPFVGGYTFDGVQHLETAPVFGLRLGYDLTKHFGVEAVGTYLATEGTRSKRSINAMSYRLDLLYNLMPDGPLVPYLAVGGGGITYGHGSNGLKIKNSTTDATVNAGFGLKYFMTDSIALRGDARQLFVLESPKSPKYNWEYTAGLTFLFGGKTAAAAPAIAPLAPTRSLTVTPASITKGESATLNWTSENTTNCDIQPGIGPVQPQGSMPITPLASTDYTLTCTGAGGTTSSAGNIQVVVPAKKERICIVLKIEFDTGKAVIKPKYHAEVGKVAEFMKKYPESNGVIEGHTDTVGGKEYNQKLSERRAASVRTYLVEKYGIAAERLTSKGYGYSKPIATNKTKAGKQKNRRIEATFDCVIVTK